MKELYKLIESHKAHVVVIGLGYVGLPLAIALAHDGYGGFKVTGLDVCEERVRLINAGLWPLNQQEPVLPGMLKKTVEAGNLTATSDYEVCRDADVIVVCVPTPVNEHKEPNYSALWQAITGIAEYARSALVIIESTLAPYTTEDIAQRLWPGVKLAHCPERVAPGCLLHNLRYKPRVIGGYTVEATELAAAFYLQVIATSELHLTDCLTAEITKTFENAYRDVQIALANELALICADLGADVWEVRKLVNTNVGRDVLEPGPGVGGPCLTKDTWLLASSMSEPPEMLLTARAINDSMPSQVVDLTIEALREAKVTLSGSAVTILGVAYRENTSDVRESPAIKIMSCLGRAGCEVRFFDPHVDGYNGDIVQSLTDSDAAIIVTPHQEFDNLNWRNLGNVMRHRVLIDTRGMVKEAPDGFVFRGLGRGNRP
jgi:UDP-N-acetyl-D-mannosaminuronic acid dehydrogenase